MRLGLLLHCVIETPASIVFLFFPHLHTHDIQAQSLLRQYGVLLCSTVVIALTSESRAVERALSVYHVAPIVRVCLQPTRYGPVIALTHLLALSTLLLS